MELDLSEDFIVIDGLESAYLEKVRSLEDGSMSFDPSTGIYGSGNSVEDSKIELTECCLFRLISERNQALVKQVFQRGVALAALDFSVVDTIIEVYEVFDLFKHFDIEDNIRRAETGDLYTIIAIDRSKLTSRLRLACRRNL